MNLNRLQGTVHLQLSILQGILICE